MKKDILKLLIKILIVTGFISVLIIYCEIKLSKLPNSYNTRRKNLEKNVDSINVLIFGTSHTMAGVNPSYLSVRGYNLANNAQSLYYDKELLLKYIDRLPRLKIIFISISIFSLWYEVYAFNDNWRDNFYSKFWDIKPNNSKIFDLNRLSYICIYGPDVAQNGFRKNFNISVEKYTDENGWFNKKTDSAFSPTDSMGIERVNFHKSMMHEDLFIKNIEYLESMLTEITNRGMNPVFITIPVHSKYYNNADPKILKKINGEISKLCLKYNCRYFDYFEDNRFHDDDFADIDHLNSMGAERFTKLLDSEIIAHIMNQKK